MGLEEDVVGVDDQMRQCLGKGLVGDAEVLITTPVEDADSTPMGTLGHLST